MHSNDYDLTFAEHAEGSGISMSDRLIIGSSIVVVWVHAVPHAAARDWRLALCCCSSVTGPSSARYNLSGEFCLLHSLSLNVPSTPCVKEGQGVNVELYMDDICFIFGNGGLRRRNGARRR
jgi:hypothetical protein